MQLYHACRDTCDDAVAPATLRQARQVAAVGALKCSHMSAIVTFIDIYIYPWILIDIHGQDGAISKEEFKKKIDNLNLNVELSTGIEEAIKTLSKNNNSITLCLGSLYLVGENLNLN